MRNVTHQQNIGAHLRHFFEQDMLDIQRRTEVLTTNTDTHNLILMACSGYAYTFTVDSQVAAIVGANILWEGVAQIWAISSDRIREHGVYYTKVVNEMLTEFAKVYCIRRYHTIVHGRSQENVRWLYLLGFTYEFCLHKAAPDGADVLGYVRWENDNVNRSKRSNPQLRKLVEKLLRVAL